LQEQFIQKFESFLSSKVVNSRLDFPCIPNMTQSSLVEKKSALNHILYYIENSSMNI